MVRTSWPSAITASVVQDLTALPSRWTTQAPHCEVSQPTWVPVSRRFSRRNWTSRVRGSILPLTGLPFTIKEILAIQVSLVLRRRISTNAVGLNLCNTIIWANPVLSNLRAERPDMLYDAEGPTTGLRRALRSALYRLGEIGEKLVGQLLGRTVDQALAKLGELAADLGLDIVAEQGTA